MKRKIYENILILIMIYCTIRRSSVLPASTNWSQHSTDRYSRLHRFPAIGVFWRSCHLLTFDMVWPSKRFRDWTNGKILIDLTLYKTHICDLLLVLVEEMLLSPLACAELTPEYFSKHASPWQSSEGNFGSSVASKCSQTFVKDGGQLPMMKQVKRLSIMSIKEMNSCSKGTHIVRCRVHHGVWTILQVQRPLLPESTRGNQCILLIRK